MKRFALFILSALLLLSLITLSAAANEGDNMKTNYTLIGQRMFSSEQWESALSMICPPYRI